MSSYKILCDIGDYVCFNVAGISTEVKLADIGLVENIDRIYIIQFHKPPKHNQLDYILSVLEQKPNISLRFYGNYDEDLIDWSSLVNIKNLQVDLWYTKNLKAIAQFKNLRSLSVTKNVKSTVSLSILEKLENLEVLYTSISKDITSISRLKNLKKLSLREVKYENLDFLIHLSRLNILWVSLGSFDNFEGLKNIENLERLWVHQVRGFTDDVADYVVKNCKSLTALKLDNLKHLSRLDFVKHMAQLSYLSMEGVKNLETYKPILESNTMETLRGYDCRPADKSLAGLVGLKEVSLGDSYSKVEIEKFLETTRAKNIWLRGDQFRGERLNDNPFSL